MKAKPSGWVSTLRHNHFTCWSLQCVKGVRNGCAVYRGLNVADRHVVELVQADDLVITADIPLAAEVVAKGGEALDPRGERLAVRDLFDELRGGGQITRGPSNFIAKDRQAFANQLDRWLTAAKD